jgi:hypothetical protein
VRYERAIPGELLHIDTKRLGRIAPGIIGHRITGNHAQRGPRQRTGWDYLHVAVDDASRVAYAALLPDETAASAVTFLDQALHWLATLGIQVTGVMTDNAFCFTQRTYSTALRTRGLPSGRAVCGTCAPGPTPHAPTARRSASFRPPYASGPMAGGISDSV